MTTDEGDRPLRLVVIGDSTSFTDDVGPQLPGAPHLYPNVVARGLADALDREVGVTVVARAGHTVREAARTVTKDRHVQFDLLGPADAVVIGVGSFDHAPGGTPAVLDAVVPYLRPAGLRRRVRTGLHRAYPWTVRATRGRLRRTPPREFERLFARLLEHVRGLTWGRAAGVVLGPISHRSPYYANTHPRFTAAERHHLEVAAAHGFTPVPAWVHVAPHADRLNPDGIHWPADAHAAVGAALTAALVDQLTGNSPRIGLPEAARAATSDTRSSVGGG